MKRLPEQNLSPLVKKAICKFSNLFIYFYHITFFPICQVLPMWYNKTKRKYEIHDEWIFLLYVIIGEDMPNGRPQLGSFAGNLGPDAQRAIQDAIQARQQGGQPVSQLSQVTPSAPSGPTPQPPSVPPGAPSAVPQGVPSPTPLPSEAESIGKALAQRLSSISKVEEALAIPPKEPRQKPQVAPVGGGNPNGFRGVSESRASAMGLMKRRPKERLVTPPIGSPEERRPLLSPLETMRF